MPRTRPLLSFTHILLELSYAASAALICGNSGAAVASSRLVITVTKHPSTEDSSNFVPVSLVGTQACALCGVSL